eukprot:SAG31_NODE_5591_length_2437_cov_1.515398_2_plen_252_part_00
MQQVQEKQAETVAELTQQHNREAADIETWLEMLAASLEAALDSLALQHNEHIVPMATANLRMYLRMESKRKGLSVPTADVQALARTAAKFAAGAAPDDFIPRPATSGSRLTSPPTDRPSESEPLPTTTTNRYLIRQSLTAQLAQHQVEAATAQDQLADLQAAFSKAEERATASQKQLATQKRINGDNKQEIAALKQQLAKAEARLDRAAAAARRRDLGRPPSRELQQIASLRTTNSGLRKIARLPSIDNIR